MSRTEPQAPRQPSLDSEPDARSAKPTGFGLVAARISSWTTKCLLSAIVLVVGLLFARQVLRWWREDPAAVVALPEAAREGSRPADSEATPVFGFGDSRWSLARRSLSGDRADVDAALKELGVKLTPSAAIPRDEIGSEEQQFLKRLAKTQPVAEQPNEWQVHVLDGPFPMAAGIRLKGGGSSSSGAIPVADGPSRVVTWVLAVPSDKTEWTLYAFYSPAPSRGAFSRLPEIPLPPESTKLLSMRAATGGTIVAFRGTAGIDRWKPFFDRWFLDEDWTPDGSWQARGGGWHRRFLAPHGPQTGSVEIRFGPDGRGGMNGLLFLYPASTTEAKSQTP